MMTKIDRGSKVSQELKRYGTLNIISELRKKEVDEAIDKFTEEVRQSNAVRVP